MLENEVCPVPKVLVVTKVTMVIEGTGDRKVIEVSPAFRVSLDLLDLLVNKAVLGFQAHLAQEVLQVQLDLQVKKEILDRMDQLGLLV